MEIYTRRSEETSHHTAKPMTLKEALEQATKAKPTSAPPQVGEVDTATILAAVHEAWEIANRSIKLVEKEIPSLPEFALAIQLGSTSISINYQRDNHNTTTITMPNAKRTIYHLSTKPELIRVYAMAALTMNTEEVVETITQNEQTGYVTFSLQPYTANSNPQGENQA
jgi:hypothetical protein